MDRKKEKKLKSKAIRIKRKTVIRWKLTDLDKRFLRSCNIDPA